MERGDKKMPLPQIHKATFFCEDMGLRNLFQGLLP